MKPARLQRTFGRIILFLLTISILLAFQGWGAEGGRQGSFPGEVPDLRISSVNGSLELGRPSSLFVILKNGAEPAEGLDDMAFRGDAARSIVAELISSESNIRILSRPQMAGLLMGGESRTLQFVALAEGVPLGIYPLQLRCNYSRLSQVRSTGEESAPDLTFHYETLSQDIALQAEAVQGPRIEIEAEDGWGRYITPGRESWLDLDLANRGDEAALDLELQVRPSPPFLMVENRWIQADIPPGGAVEASLSLFADENASNGYYALPCLIAYRVGQDEEKRREEMATLVYVDERLASPWIYLGAAASALLLLLGLWWAVRKAHAGRRRVRIIRS